MSKNLYDEAIAEAKLLRETAEQNAKNAIIEAVTPRIRKFIEEQLLENKGSASDESDVLEDVISDMLHEGSGSDGSGENVALDETALSELVTLLGGDSNSDSEDQIKDAVLESFNSLSTKDRKNLSTVANKLKQNANFLHSSDINNDVHLQQESSRMPRSEDILYEVNLEELASELGEMQMDDGYHQEVEEDMELEGSDDAFIDDMLSEIDDGDDGDADETVELEEVLKSLGLEGLLSEDKIEIDLGDVELPEDSMLTATRIADEEEDLDLEDVEAAEEDFGDDDVELDDEDFGDEPEDLQEVFDIDPRVLRSELKRLRLKIREAKDLTSIKGIKDAKESHFGGSGSGKAGLKGAYGGTGGSKTGVDGSYGGGKGTGDPLKVKLNKLSEAIKNERRRNRSLEGKLNEYRSAVEHFVSN